MIAARVSVIIPAYKAAGTIARAVDSVLAQSVPAYEVLIVDDGSPDDLAEAVARYGDRITLLRKENGGAASARNLGIDRATGDFIAFLDADDYWEAGKLEQQLGIFAAHAEVGLVAGRFYEQDPNGCRKLASIAQHVVYDKPVTPRGAAAFELAMHIWTGATIVRREMLGEQRFVSGLEPAEDRDLWVRIANTSTVYLCAGPLVTAVLEPGSLSRTQLDRDCGNMLRVIYRNRDLLSRLALRKWVSHTHYRWAACEPRPDVALLRLGQSFVGWPLPFRRSDMSMFCARPKLLVVSLLRIFRNKRVVGMNSGD